MLTAYPRNYSVAAPPRLIRLSRRSERIPSNATRTKVLLPRPLGKPILLFQRELYPGHDEGAFHGSGGRRDSNRCSNRSAGQLTMRTALKAELRSSLNCP
jgi:hypothetical protein